MDVVFSPSVPPQVMFGNYDLWLLTVSLSRLINLQLKFRSNALVQPSCARCLTSLYDKSPTKVLLELPLLQPSTLPIFVHRRVSWNHVILVSLQAIYVDNLYLHISSNYVHKTNTRFSSHHCPMSDLGRPHYKPDQQSTLHLTASMFDNFRRS